MVIGSIVLIQRNSTIFAIYDHFFSVDNLIPVHYFALKLSV